MGRGAVARRRHGHAETSSSGDSAAPVGTYRRWLHGAPVCRTASPDHRGAECRRPRYARVRASPVRPGSAERGCAPRGGVYEGDTGAPRWRDRARWEGRSDRVTTGETERGDSLRDPRQGPEIALRVPAQFNAPLHAGVESARSDGGHRRGRRLSELSRGLCGGPEAERGRPADDSTRLQPVHAETQGGKDRLSQLGEDLTIQAGRRLFPAQRRRGDARVLGCGLRGFPGASARHAPGDGGRARSRGAHSCREPLAMAIARDIRRDHQPCPRCLRTGQSGHSTCRPEVVL